MHPCEEKGIPEHLWQKDRINVEDFEEGEKLYRRFKNKSPHVNNIEKHDSTSELKAFSAHIFQLKEDSYNRSSFCNSAEDVLYNDNGDFKAEYGIFEINAKDLFLKFEASVNNKIETIEVYAIHQCLECNYPHCIFQFKVAGVIPAKPNPNRVIKDLVRSELFPKITILKNSSA